MSELAETYEHEGPKCPYCARQYTADEPHYYDEMNFTDMECDGCGKTFNVEVYTSTSWTCTALPDENTHSHRQGGET